MKAAPRFWTSRGPEAKVHPEARGFHIPECSQSLSPSITRALAAPLGASDHKCVSPPRGASSAWGWVLPGGGHIRHPPPPPPRPGPGPAGGHPLVANLKSGVSPLGVPGWGGGWASPGVGKSVTPPPPREVRVREQLLPARGAQKDRGVLPAPLPAWSASRP